MGSFSKLSISDVDFAGKAVLMRVDFNVPLDKETGKITNTQRIDAALPSIQYALQNGASPLILMSHLGRPNGQVVPKLSLKVVLPVLTERLKTQVEFASDCVGEATEKLVKETSAKVVVLENLRFHPEEEGKYKDDAGKSVKVSEQKVKDFRSALSRLGQLYINDAFGTAHRAHSSMVGVHLDKRAAGFLLKKELDYFGMVLGNAQKPFVSILGGAKVEDKIQLIMNLLDKVDEMIIGGGMVFTFMKIVHNMQIGASLFDEKAEKEGLVPKIMQKAKEKNVKIHLATDFIAANKFAKDAETQICTVKDGIKEGWLGLDIGPHTGEQFKQVCLKAKTIVWNGPMGVFEFESFRKGTAAVMEGVVKATQNGCTSVIGGGDTATCCSPAYFNTEDKVSHVSTGGGASLELLEGKALPGIVALSDKPTIVNKPPKVTPGSGYKKQIEKQKTFGEKVTEYVDNLGSGTVVGAVGAVALALGSVALATKKR